MTHNHTGVRECLVSCHGCDPLSVLRRRRWNFRNLSPVITTSGAGAAVGETYWYVRLRSGTHTDYVRESRTLMGQLS